MRSEYVVPDSFLAILKNSLVSWTPGYAIILIQVTLLLKYYWWILCSAVLASNDL